MGIASRDKRTGCLIARFALSFGVDFFASVLAEDFGEGVLALDSSGGNLVGGKSVLGVAVFTGARGSDCVNGTRWGKRGIRNLWNIMRGLVNRNESTMYAAKVIKRWRRDRYTQAINTTILTASTNVNNTIKNKDIHIKIKRNSCGI